MRPSTGVRGLPALRRVNLTLRCGSWRALCGQWYGIRMLRAALAQRWRASRLLHVSCGHLHRGLVSRSRHHSWEERHPSWGERGGRTERDVGCQNSISAPFLRPPTRKRGGWDALTALSAPGERCGPGKRLGRVKWFTSPNSPSKYARTTAQPTLGHHQVPPGTIPVAPERVSPRKCVGW